MNQLNLGLSGLKTSAISLGCMRINKLEKPAIEKLIKTSLEVGIDFFEHADIYGGGKSEEVFSEAIGMNAKVRETMKLQTKCGIKKGQYDFSKEHILASVDGSLKRLKTDYVDALLLHRPDTLVEPEEVAAAFNKLKVSGKVRHFGVSNHNMMQIELLKKSVKEPLIINQLQLSVTNTGMIDSGLNVNMKNDFGINRDDSILEYSRLKDMTIQAWSPFQYGFFEGVFVGSPKFPVLNAKLDELALAYGVTPSAIAIAWILRHPAKIQPILGTTDYKKVIDIAKATTVTLTRTQWYELYLAAGNKLP